MPEKVPRAYIAFSEEPTRFTPGRLRLRAPGLRHARAEIAGVARVLGEVDGVLEVKTRAHTGSVLILHVLPSDLLIERLVAVGAIRLEPRDQTPRAWSQLTSEERAILEGGVYLLLSFVQVYRGKALGAGSSLLGNAIESIRHFGLEKELAKDEVRRPSVLATLANLK